MQNDQDTTSPYGAYRLKGWPAAMRQMAQACRWKPAVRLLRLFGGLRARQLADVTFYGSQFRLYPQKNRSDKMILGYPHLYDRGEFKTLQPYLQRSGAILLDIGANIGAYSAFALHAGCQKIVAVEADPAVFARLCFNLPTVTVTKMNLAVAPEAGRVTLYRHAVNQGSNSLINNGGEPVSVLATPLKNLIEEQLTAAPTVMKIDIEGAEHDMLTAFFDTALPAHWPRVICFEWIHDKRLVPLLQRHGYQEIFSSKMNMIMVRAEDG